VAARVPGGAARRGPWRLFENLRRVFDYLIAFHIPIALLALAVPLLNQPLLLLPIQLVLLELVLHPTIALVFEGDPPSPELMTRPPRPRNAGLISGRQAV
jgi:Ca2+-transporting ATPase